MNRTHRTLTQRPHWARQSKTRGFTLIEVLVAIGVMSLMSLMA